jgi:hypothetical protein
MRIDSSGNVGIGTSSPSTYGKFAVQGNSAAGTVVSAIVNQSGTANSQAVLSFDPGANGFNVRDSQIRATNNGSNQTTLEFYTANATTPVERMRITNGGGVSFGATGTAYGTSGQVLTSAGNAPPTWTTAASANTASAIVQRDASGNFSAGTITAALTGSATGLSATLVATSGGTGQSSYAIGDLLYASTTTALSKLADVATGNALISGGVSTAPAWGKIGLTTHVSGTLPVANGGTGVTSSTGSGNTVLSTSPTLTTPVIGAATGTSLVATAGVTGSVVTASNGLMVNSNTVAANYTIATGNNAMSAGPVTVNSSMVVTVSSGSRWVVV